MLFLRPKNLAALIFLALFSLSTQAAQSKDIYYYIDMPCLDLMEKVSGDAFVEFARKEIRENIGDQFCSMIKEQSGEDFDFEAQRDYISMAEYSKLIDSLYTQFHFADSSPAN